jgi:hypothetical protein
MAAELFIAELSLAAWMNVPAGKKIVQVKDISAAVATFHSYDFLLDLVPPPVAKPKRVVRINCGHLIIKYLYYTFHE